MLLTTQYLEEAEQLADRIAILHEGRIIADGTLAELRQLLPPAEVEYVEKQPTLEEVFLAVVGDATTGDAPADARSTMTTHFIADTTVLLGRSLRHVTRSPDTIITTAVMPIAFLLLFVYVFGGAIDTGSGSYVDYLLPGHPAHHDRVGHLLHRVPAVPGPAGRHLRALPVHADRALRGAVGPRADLAGREPRLARRRRGRGRAHGLPLERGRAGAWLAVAGILVLFTLALTWLAVIAGLSATTVDGASAFSYPLIFLPFVSSAFVPTDTMPGRCAPSPSTSR